MHKETPQTAGVSRWHLTDSQPDDEADVLDLFQHVFGSEMSHPLWCWKYGEGRGHACLAWHQNLLVAHYGGMRRKISLFGDAKDAVQIGDVMVRLSERGSLSRKGPFMRVATSFLEQYVGDNKRYVLGYGFPTRRAMLAAERQGLYKQVDRIVEHRWQLKSLPSSIFDYVLPLSSQSSRRDKANVDHLWQKMKQCFRDSILGVRDWEFLHHRYFQHPHRDYDLYLVKKRLTGTPLGVVVLFHEGKRCRLMDVVGCKTDFSRLIFHAQKIAFSRGADQLYGWVTQSHSHYWTGDVVPQDVCIPTNVWSKGLAVEDVTNRWWLTSGDADFC